MFVFYRAMLGIMSGYDEVVGTFAKYVQRIYDGTEGMWVAKSDSFTWY